MGQASPSREHLDSVATKRAEIYRCRPPEGIRVPILIMTAAVEDGIPGGEEVEQAVRNLKRVISGGLSGMRTKDLNGWLRDT